MGQEIEIRGNYLFNLIQTDVSTVNETLKPMPMWKEIFQADSPAKAEFSAHLGDSDQHCQNNPLNLCFSTRCSRAAAGPSDVRG